MKTKIYLAHPFDERHNLRYWELTMEIRYPNIEIVNPFYDITRKDIDAVDRGDSERYACSAKEIVERDVAAIRDCSHVVAFVTGALSYGTIQEMVYAWSEDIPVFTVVTNGHEKHPWLVYHSDIIFTNRDDLEKELNVMNAVGRHT